MFFESKISDNGDSSVATEVVEGKTFVDGKTIIVKSVYGEDKLAIIGERIAKLNQRAVAKGFSQVEINSELDYIGHELKSGVIVAEVGPKDKATGRTVAVYKLEIVFPKLAIGDWELLGALKPLHFEDGTSENLLNSVPGKSIPVKYSKLVGKCDHCGYHRNRAETFVVKNLVTGDTHSVGRNCIKDFLGHDPEQLLWIYSQIDELQNGEEWEFGGGSAVYSYDLKNLVAVSKKVIDVDGWVSSGSVQYTGGLSTKSIVIMLLDARKPSYFSHSEWASYKEERESGEAEAEFAEKAIEWAKGLEKEGYEKNLSLVARLKSVAQSEMGLAVSLASAYMRAMTNEKLYKDKAPELDAYYGVIGERSVVEVFVIKVIPIETMYGTSGLHIMRTTEGHSIKWFSTGSWLKEGETYKVKLTVKDHDEYKGKKQTSVSRVAVYEEPEPKPKKKSKKALMAEAIAAESEAAANVVAVKNW